jgi:hypothetical protein
VFLAKPRAWHIIAMQSRFHANLLCLISLHYRLCFTAPFFFFLNWGMQISLSLSLKHKRARAHTHTHTHTHTHIYIYIYIKQMQINTTKHLNLQLMTLIKVNCYMPWVSCNVKSLLVHRLNSGNTHYCGGMGINFLTHTLHMHMHNCMCMQHYFSVYVRCLCQLLACCCIKIASHWHYFVVATSRATLSQCL